MPITFAEILGRWIDHVSERADLADWTKTTYTRMAKHLRRWAGTRCGCHVDLADYVDARRELGIAPRTLELEARVAGIAWRWAEEAGLLREGAALSVPEVTVDPGAFVLNHRTPKPGEVSRVIAAMRKDEWRLATRILARTGARVGEVVALRKRDFDEGGGRLRFGSNSGASKTGIRWFPLDARTRAELAGRGVASDDLLLDFGEITAPIQAIGRRLRDACRRAEVPEFSPHGLRRMVVSQLLRSGVDVGTAATLTGHSVEVMLSFYQQVTDEDRRAAVERAGLGTLG